MEKIRRRIEYIWLDGTPSFPQVRSKTRYINIDESYGGIPDWNFDGGSTGQGDLNNSDRLLTCVRTYSDPFNEGGLLALCDVRYHSGVPHESNLRIHLATLLEKHPEAGYLVGLEQEFTFINPATLEPLGLLLSPKQQGQYYCGAGCMNVIGRFIVNEFEEKVKEAGIEIDGINAEVMPGQWEWQTAAQGPLKTADDLWVSRYILDRVAETNAAIVSYDPKPHPDMNGAGCHANVSTAKMRECFQLDEQEELMVHMEVDHKEHIKICGKGIQRRMTGECETSDYREFTWGVGDRGASIRIPERVKLEGAGYFEDRRPCANIDPYSLLYSLISTVNKSKVL
jgi:glutamine synthetase